jgi:hypothetical protein
MEILMKRITLILAFAMLAAFTSVAQEKPKTDAPKTDAKAVALPTVDKILDNYVKALGGKEAIEKITSRSVKGTFDIEAMSISAPVEMYAKAPNKTAMKIDVPNIGVVNRVFDGSSGWDSSPMSIARIERPRTGANEARS